MIGRESVRVSTATAAASTLGRTDVIRTATASPRKDRFVGGVYTTTDAAAAGIHIAFGRRHVPLMAPHTAGGTMSGGGGLAILHSGGGGVAIPQTAAISGGGGGSGRPARFSGPGGPGRTDTVTLSPPRSALERDLDSGMALVFSGSGQPGPSPIRPWSGCGGGGVGGGEGDAGPGPGIGPGRRIPRGVTTLGRLGPGLADMDPRNGAGTAKDPQNSAGAARAPDLDAVSRGMGLGMGATWSAGRRPEPAAAAPEGAGEAGEGYCPPTPSSLSNLNQNRMNAESAAAVSAQQQPHASAHAAVSIPPTNKSAVLATRSPSGRALGLRVGGGGRGGGGAPPAPAVAGATPPPSAPVVAAVGVVGGVKYGGSPSTARANPSAGGQGGVESLGLSPLRGPRWPCPPSRPGLSPSHSLYVCLVLSICISIQRAALAGRQGKSMRALCTLARPKSMRAL